MATSFFWNQTMRVLCAWFPNWTVQRLREKNAQLKAQPIVVYETNARGMQSVVAASSEAYALGVSIGMRAAEASGVRGISSEHLFERDAWADRHALEYLTFWCEQFSPCVGVMGTETLVFEVHGTSHLFGGEAEHVETIRKAFSERGLNCRLALADTSRC